MEIRNSNEQNDANEPGFLAFINTPIHRGASVPPPPPTVSTVCSGVRASLAIPLVFSSLLSSASESPLSRSDWGAPDVTVSRAGGTWKIVGKKRTVSLNETNLALQIQTGSITWSMVPSGTNDLLVRSGTETFPLRLADARAIRIVRYDT